MNVKPEYDPSKLLETLPAPRVVDVVRRSLDHLIGRFPASWLLEVRAEVRVANRSIDAIVDLVASDRTEARLVVEAKLTVEPSEVSALISQARDLAALLDNDRSPSALIVVARYLSRPVRNRLDEAGIGYADATGNLLLRLERPALFIRDIGADRDPWRGPGRPRGTLKGATAARLVRALADFAPPFSVPELAKRSETSIGATYRMVEFLEREDLITREPRSPISRVDWRGIVQRWGDDLGTGQLDRMSLYLEPRGLPALLSNLATAGDLRYVLTGTLAARYYEEHVPSRLAVLYADPVEPLIEHLGLRESPAGNVLVGVPMDGVAFARASTKGAGLVVAAPSQIAVDLLGGPGRGPGEAEALLDWMERNPGAWRT